MKTNKTKTTLAIAMVIILAALEIMVEGKRIANYEAYAKANNCTWQATGAFYGDDRDFICK